MGNNAMAPDDSNPLAGKSVVISGATSGIGWRAALTWRVTFGHCPPCCGMAEDSHR